MKTSLRVCEFEDRLTPAAGIDTAYGTYSWVLINNLRQNPTAFANNLQGLVNGSVGAAFGIAASDPVVADLKAMIAGASNPGNYGASLSLMRSTPGTGPLAWDNLLQQRAQIHDQWMEANGFAHTQTTGTRTAVPGFSANSTAAPDDWGYGYPTYSSWGEDIAWAVGSLSSTKAAYNAGGITLAGLYQRAAFLDVAGYVLELNSGSLGHLENLLGRDSGASGSLPSFNVFGEDLHLYQAPAQFEAQDSVAEAWIDTQRFGLYRPNGTGGFITGVAWQDANGNGFYDGTEGQAGATINIRDANGNGVTDTANAFGAFSTYLTNGTYTVTASANGAVISNRTVSINNSNAWADMAVGSLGRAGITGPTGSQTNLRPTVTWNPTDGATAYQLAINDLTTGISNLFPGAATTATYWTPTSDLVSGHQYSVWVRPLRGTSAGAWSDPDKFSITAPTPTGPAAMVNGLRPTLTWNGVAGATYQVFANDITGALTNIFPNATTTGTSWTTPTDLVSGHSYAWVVRAVGTSGPGSWSPVATFTITKPTPTGPGSGVTAVRPAFTWTPVYGAAAYVVIVNDVTANKVGAFSARVTDNTWTPPSDLVSGRTYAWQVQAVNAAGQGAWGPPAQFTMGRVTPIGPGVTSATVQPTLTWAGLAGGFAYQVQVDDMTTGKNQVFLQIVFNSQSFTPDAALTRGHTYRWWVRAIVADNAGALNGAWSDPTFFKVL